MAKIAVTVALLAIAFYWVDVSRLWTVLSTTSMPLFALATILIMTAQLIAVVRFGRILDAFQRPMAMREVGRIFFIGNWFAQLLPTALGGDAMRVLLLRRRMGIQRAVRATLLNRVLGLTTLLLLPVLIWPLIPAALADDAVITILVAACLVLSTGVGAAAWLSKAVRRWRWIPRPFRWAAVPLFDLRRIVSSAYGPTLVITSILVAVFTVSALFVLCLAIGESHSYWLLSALSALVVVAMHIPISYAGWGTREVSALALLSLAGLGPANALAVSILYGCAFFLASVPGLVLWHGSGLATAGKVGRQRHVG